MTPAIITDAITKVGGTIEKCEPVCDGSRHFVVTFTAPADVSAITGISSLARLAPDRYRVHFILTPEK